MTWWYEIQDADHHVLETKRRYPTQEEAQRDAEIARRNILDISPGRVLLVVTGEDVWRPE